ncbi:MAG: DUF3800 domain-containing protein [Deltaproteobacteria bacterium]|nr:DUF3800 domain-containing protein [Deltaproteobacteria bacterium]
MINNEPINRWPLDLSLAATRWCTSYWYKRIGNCHLIWDKSKALSQQEELFKKIIGCENKNKPPKDPVSIDEPYAFYTRTLSFSFKDSRESYGLQLADLLVGYAVKAAKNNQTTKSLAKTIGPCSVMPAKRHLPMQSIMDREQALKVLREVLANWSNK